MPYTIRKSWNEYFNRRIFWMFTEQLQEPFKPKWKGNLLKCKHSIGFHARVKGLNRRSQLEGMRWQRVRQYIHILR